MLSRLSIIREKTLFPNIFTIIFNGNNIRGYYVTHEHNVSRLIINVQLDVFNGSDARVTRWLIAEINYISPTSRFLFPRCGNFSFLFAQRDLGFVPWEGGELLPAKRYVSSGNFIIYTCRTLYYARLGRYHTLFIMTNISLGIIRYESLSIQCIRYFAGISAEKFRENHALYRI